MKSTRPFTRGLEEKIKRNHEYVDAVSYWVSSDAGAMFDMWLFNLECRFPLFDRDAYIYYDSITREFYNEFVKDSTGFDLDLEKLKKKYPEICIIDRHAAQYLQKKAYMANLKKLDWIYENLSEVVGTNPRIF